MIEFSYQTEYEDLDEKAIAEWIEAVANHFSCSVGEIHYVFADDEYVWELNKKFLDHDTYTDIITFDYREGDQLNGEIYISVDRVKDNAVKFAGQKQESLETQNLVESEMLRVMVHGLLHMVGYKDSNEDEKHKMRQAENDMIKLFHVKHSANV